MDFFKCVESRRSIRAFRRDPIEADRLEAILEAGRLAPTACDYQPFRFVVIETKGREQELRKIYDKDWFVAAPVILLVCSLPGEAWSRKDGKNYADVDATIAMDHMILAASAFGLGSCWVGAFDPSAAREVLKLGAEWEPLAFAPIGYPMESPAPRPRKAMAELVLRL